jgi:hypothetical protein
MIEDEKDVKRLSFFGICAILNKLHEHELLSITGYKPMWLLSIQRAFGFFHLVTTI